MEVVENLPSQIETGVYYGYARIDDGEVYKMVMSIGWNPYYKNIHKSMVSKSNETKKRKLKMYVVYKASH